MELVEKTLTDMLLNEQHFYLLLGIFGFFLIVKKIGPLKFLFTDKYNWIVPILNLGLSTFGIFVLHMTNATTQGLKITIAVVISAVATYGYETIKTLLEKIIAKTFGTSSTPTTP